MKPRYPVDLASVVGMETILPVDHVMDYLYDMVHDALLARQFDVVNKQLLKVVPEKWSTQMLIGLLTVTNAAKNRLSHRAALRDKIRAVLTARIPSQIRVDRLMAGL